MFRLHLAQHTFVLTLRSLLEYLHHMHMHTLTLGYYKKGTLRVGRGPLSLGTWLWGTLPTNAMGRQSGTIGAC